MDGNRRVAVSLNVVHNLDMLRWIRADVCRCYSRGIGDGYRVFVFLRAFAGGSDSAALDIDYNDDG